MKKVLLVENKDDVERQTNWIINQFGNCHFTVANNIEDAILFLKDKPFDIIVIGLELPQNTLSKPKPEIGIKFFENLNSLLEKH